MSKRALRALLPALASLLIGTTGAAQTAPTAADAKAVLKSSAAFISSLKTLELEFDSDIEAVTPELEKIQFTNSGSLTLSRPNKLWAHRVGGYADVALYFDGKTATVHGRNIDAYAQFAAPGTVDDLIEALRAGHGIAVPGADLLLSQPYEALVADVLEAKHIGRGVVDGVECEHLAFRNFDTDWQIWVEVGDRPFPRKLVITSKTIAGAPQYTLRVKRWKSGFTADPAMFQFTPPAGARRIEADQLIGLDELPPEAPAGARP
jgi:hypothetical protein